MSDKSLSILGHLLNYLHISTSELAHTLHVDPSLVSKWKNGSRSLTEKSVYFEDLISYFLEKASPDEHLELKKALLTICPSLKANTAEQTEYALRQVLSGNDLSMIPDFFKLFSGMTTAVPTLTFAGNSGKRDALKKILDCAFQMPIPGELTFMDAGNFNWMTEESDFAEFFTNSISELSARGFVCRFLINYDSSQEDFSRFFSATNSLVFQRNISWYYLPYFNSPLFNISIILLSQAISLLSISSQNRYSSSTLSTDSALVLTHDALLQHIYHECHPVFHNFELKQLAEIIQNIHLFHRRSGIFYCVLSAPAFITVNSQLLTDILKSNHVDSGIASHCLSVHRLVRSLSTSNFMSDTTTADPIIMVFRYNKMIERATHRPFISRSLSLICGKKIEIFPSQYAQQLRILADKVIQYKNLQIILSADHDSPTVSPIDFWTKQNTWLLQMDHNGFRYCEDPGIIHAASAYMAKCIKHIPSSRKEAKSVRHYLLDLASDLEKM